MEEELIKTRLEPMVDYIMKNCLWQFNSRTWDRKEQNENILNKTTQLLCGEPVELETPADRCYWVDAKCLVETYRKLCLKDRGLKGVKLVVSDKCLGLYEIIGDFFPEAKWQRCIVHWYRNAFTMCPWKHVRDVAAMLKAIHAQEDREAAKQKAALVAEKLRKLKLDKVAEFVENSVEETLSYMYFPYEHWSRLRTNNALERIMKEIRRRTRVIGAFPDGYSALMLVGARLRHISSTKWGTRQYMNTGKLYEGGVW